MSTACSSEIFTTWLLGEGDAKSQSSLKWRRFELYERSKISTDLLHLNRHTEDVFFNRHSARTHWYRRNSCEGKEFLSFCFGLPGSFCSSHVEVYDCLAFQRFVFSVSLDQVLESQNLLVFWEWYIIRARLQ